MNRDIALHDLREATIGAISGQSSPEEVFQNKTLRPILKFQNDLFVSVFINYAVKQKGTFFTLGPEKKLEYIEHTIHRDIKFRNALKGMVIGMFTCDEYEAYIQNSSSLNKRMMNMLIERLKSHVQLLEKVAS